MTKWKQRLSARIKNGMDEIIDGGYKTGVGIHRGVFYIETPLSGNAMIEVSLIWLHPYTL